MGLLDGFGDLNDRRVIWKSAKYAENRLMVLNLGFGPILGINELQDRNKKDD